MGWVVVGWWEGLLGIWMGWVVGGFMGWVVVGG